MTALQRTASAVTMGPDFSATAERAFTAAAGAPETIWDANGHHTGVRLGSLSGNLTFFATTAWNAALGSAAVITV
jgi:hypothetical protein